MKKMHKQSQLSSQIKAKTVIGKLMIISKEVKEIQIALTRNL